MPIFEYKCKNCNFQFEELVRKGEKIKCPKCGSRNLEKLPSLIASAKKECSFCQKSNCKFCLK